MTYIQFSLTIILLHNQEVFWKPIKSSFATYSLIEADQILTWNHQLLIWFLCSIHWINWIQKVKLKIQFFVDILTFLYTLNREDKKTFIPLLKKCCRSHSKCIKKLSNFHLYHRKNFWCLVYFLVSVYPTNWTLVI